MANRAKPLKGKMVPTESDQRWASEAEIKTWMRARQMDLVSDYVARGRCHEGLPTEQLEAAWIETYRRNTSKPTQVLARLEADMEAEFFLHRRSVPLQVVAENIRTRIEAAAADTQHLKQTDPQGFLDANEEMQRDIDAFMSKGGKPGN
jgi:phage terminase small subunit